MFHTLFSMSLLRTAATLTLLLRVLSIPNSSSARASICTSLSAVIERSCFDWANHAENCRIPKDARCDRTIQDNASIFQQALYASFS